MIIIELLVILGALIKDTHYFRNYARLILNK